MLRKFFSKHKTLVEVRPSMGRGRGIFAITPLKKGNTIETSPVLIIPTNEMKNINETILHQYHFDWISNNQVNGAIGLGFLSLYNHSASPNATFLKNYNDNTITIVAHKDIEKDEEIFIDYKEDYSHPPEKLWFE